MDEHEVGNMYEKAADLNSLHARINMVGGIVVADGRDGVSGGAANDQG